MKILRIISSMDPENGGPCQGIRNSIPAQEKLGVHNEVLCFDAPSSGFLKKDDFIIHAIGPAIGPYAFCYGLKSWLKANLSRFDVVIIHGVWLYNSFGSYFFWRRFKQKNRKAPKIYLMPHGMLDPYFQKAENRKLKAVRNLMFWQLIEKRVINGSDGLLFTCEEELLLARTTFRPYKPKAELNIGYGIQAPPALKEELLQEFLEKCPGVGGKAFWLFLSRIHQKKGVDLLINAYLKLKTSHPNIPDLVIAGPGLETSYGKSLRRAGEGHRIHFPGMLSGNAKWGAFYGAECFILPSHQENFGIAVVEALACAKPVLISDQINIWREIEKGTGGLVSKDTEKGVYSLLQRWLGVSESEKLHMGKNARAIYENHFTIPIAATRMIGALAS